jgi:hypothetical protein
MGIVTFADIIDLPVLMALQLVDCTLAYHFHHRPLLTLDDGQAALPSHESLWQADSEETWMRLLDKPQGISYAVYLDMNPLLTH